MCSDEHEAHRFGHDTYRLAARRAEVSLDLSQSPGIVLAVGAQENLQLLVVKSPGNIVVEALQEQRLICAPEAAKQSQFRQHCAITAGEIGQEGCLLQDVTTDDA